MALVKNVLVVDDEAMIRESVSAYITKQGYHVFAAGMARGAGGLPEVPHHVCDFRFDAAGHVGRRSLPGDPQTVKSADHYADSQDAGK